VQVQAAKDLHFSHDSSALKIKCGGRNGRLASVVGVTLHPKGRQ
jgi:hypothetical protein